MRDHSAFVFDLDGTFSDPLEGIARCYNHALTTHGFAARTDTELAKLVGPPLDQGFLALGVPPDQELVDSHPTYLIVRPDELIE